MNFKTYNVASEARETKFNSKIGAYQNGYNNNYAVRVEEIIRNSPTAAAATNLIKKYIIGEGLKHFNNFVVNEKGDTFFDFYKKVANDFATHGGCFISVQYDGNADIISVDVLPYTHCLVGKRDDKDYSGKILVSKEYSPIFSKKKYTPIDVFNPKKKIIEAQFEKNKGNYNGQILFFNPSNEIYPLAPIHSALLDAESEREASIFKNSILKTGFQSKMLMVVPKMTDDDEKKLDESIKKFLGARNAGGVMTIAVESTADDIDKVIKFKEVNSNVNDKVFAYTEESVRKNILLCLGVPDFLIRNNDSGIFGNSGALLIEAQKMMTKNTEEERRLLKSKVFDRIFTKFKNSNYANN